MLWRCGGVRIPRPVNNTHLCMCTKAIVPSVEKSIFVANLVNRLLIMFATNSRDQTAYSTLSTVFFHTSHFSDILFISVLCVLACVRAIA